jgi:hypothetical protein
VVDGFVYLLRVCVPLVEKGKKIKLPFFLWRLHARTDARHALPLFVFSLCPLPLLCELALLPSTTVSLPGLAGAGVVGLPLPVARVAYGHGLIH